MTPGKKYRIFGVLAACYALALLLVFGCSREGREAEVVVKTASGMDWKEPGTCMACHEEEHRAWAGSHHAAANRLVDAERDAARFSVGEFEDLAGRVYRVEQEGERSFLSERNADGDFVAAEVKAMIGKTPLQQPLVEAEGGRWQAHAMAWDTEKGEWFNVFGGEERLAGEWGHWTGQGMNWNSNCAWCHTTEYEKGFDLMTDSYASSWTHQGISCIACHDGMETHVATAGKVDFVAAAAPSKQAMMENCASCHARREGLTDGAFEAGDRFDDHFRLMLYDHPAAYFPDGKAKEENFVYGSFMHSKMGHAGVSCLDCHDAHSNELTLPVETNATCIQCHSTGNLGATIVDVSTHSRHAVGTAGSSCVECHMPERDYMARDPRRDHGFTIPDPYMEKAFGVGDACSTCHDDLGTDELLAAFDGWYGESSRVVGLRERAHLLADAWGGSLDSPERILKRMETEVNPYWLASWLRLLRPFAQEDEVGELAARLAASEEAIVRDAALFVLGARGDSLAALQSAFQDSSRMVRMQAADTLSESPYLEGRVEEEYEAYLLANADRPSGALRLAARAAREGDAVGTRRFGELAIRFDRKNASIRYDVAVLYDRVGLAEEAMKHLRIAHGYDGSTGLYLYSLGLTLAERGRLVEAAEAMRQGLEIEPEQDRWWYNLSVAQTRLGEVAEARESLRRALAIRPDAEDYQAFAEQLGVSE